MKQNVIASFFERVGLHVVRLDESQTGLLQDLQERCRDFIQLATGHPPQPTEAIHLLRALPPGKSSEDKFVLGFSRNHSVLVGVLELVRGYPDPFTWYIGLLMLDPQERGQGLGYRIYETLEQWVITQGDRSLRLIVQAQNLKRLAFWRRVGFEFEETATQAIATGTNVVYKMVHHLTVPEEGAV